MPVFFIQKLHGLLEVCGRLSAQGHHQNQIPVAPTRETASFQMYRL